MSRLSVLVLLGVEGHELEDCHRRPRPATSSGHLTDFVSLSSPSVSNQIEHLKQPRVRRATCSIDGWMAMATDRAVPLTLVDVGPVGREEGSRH